VHGCAKNSSCAALRCPRLQARFWRAAAAPKPRGQNRAKPLPRGFFQHRIGVAFESVYARTPNQGGHCQL